MAGTANPRASRRSIRRSMGGTLAAGSLAEHLGERMPQRDIHLGWRRDDALGGERGYAVLAHAARHDAAVVAEIGLVVERHAVIGHALAHAHADGADLGVVPAALVDPHADAALAAFARDIERGQRTDQPFLEIA